MTSEFLQRTLEERKNIFDLSSRWRSGFSLSHPESEVFSIPASICRRSSLINFIIQSSTSTNCTILPSTLFNFEFSMWAENRKKKRERFDKASYSRSNVWCVRIFIEFWHWHISHRTHSRHVTLTFCLLHLHSSPSPTIQNFFHPFFSPPDPHSNCHNPLDFRLPRFIFSCDWCMRVGGGGRWRRDEERKLAG